MHTCMHSRKKTPPSLLNEQLPLVNSKKHAPPIPANGTISKPLLSLKETISQIERVMKQCHQPKHPRPRHLTRNENP